MNNRPMKKYTPAMSGTYKISIENSPACGSNILRMGGTKIQISKINPITNVNSLCRANHDSTFLIFFFIFLNI